ncbi:MAG: MarR family transcriptional regulator [Cyclobacteriaceae bacterium]|nr:MarR family transcriptional regulator [Cyclobacteriaceae bacterium]
MSLESEIRQEHFQSEHHKAAINILVTGSWLYNQNANFLRQYDLTPEQFNVLRILRGSHPKPMMLLDITARMIDKNSNCTRLVEKLRQKGWVTRELCATNRRQVDISITTKGLQLLKRIDSQSTEWLRALRKLTKAEASELNRLLDKIRV